MLGDTVLKKADKFQGKRKVKDQWSKVEYDVICQDANGVPSYKIKNTSGNLQVAHCNQLFLLVTPQGEVMPLSKSKDTNSIMSTWFALVELTPLECENDLPKDLLERCQTHHLASHIPLGWVDGVLQPLPMVVHRSAQKEPGSRIREMHGDDEEVHWVLLVIPPSTHIIPKFYYFGGERGILLKWEWYCGDQANLARRSCVVPCRLLIEAISLSMCPNNILVYLNETWT